MQVIKCFQVFCWLETPYYSTGDKLARCLPALHALTGCDTTSKISTKHAPMQAIHNYLTLILNFTLIKNVCNNSELIQKAENLLVRCLKPTKDLKHLMTCVLLLLLAIPSKWTLRKFPARQPMQESIFKGHIINNSCGYKPHLKMV